MAAGEIGAAAVRQGRRPVGRLAVMLGLAAMLAPALLPAEAAAQVAANRSFDIAPQLLSAALRRFAEQSGMQLAYRTADLGGIRSPGFRGAAPNLTVLARLLSGTGIAYTVTAANTVTIARAAAPAAVAGAPAGTISLDTINVQGQVFGPVEGFVAADSMSASKTDLPLIKTPASVSVVTRQQMDAQAVQTVPQALRYTAGVQAETRGAMTALDYIYARGFPANQYQDGLRLQTSGGYALPQPDPYNLERVEVLRGPASVLYGQGDLGGTVGLMSKRPTATPFHEIQFQAGSYGRLQTSFDTGGPIDEDGVWSYRLSGTGHAADTQVRFARDERIAIAPALRWQPNADTSLTILGNFQYDPAVGFYNWVPAYGTVLRNPSRPGAKLPTSLNTGDPNFDKYQRTLASIGYQFEHRFNDVWTVRQNVRYSHVDSIFDKVYSSYLDTDFHTLQRYVWRLKDRLDGIAVDNQAEADFATGPLKHKLLLGVDYQHTDYRQDLGYDFNSGTGPGQVPPIDIFAPVYNQPIPVPRYSDTTKQAQDQIGLYAQDHIEIGRLNILIGGREDFAGSRTDNFYFGAPTGALKESDHAFTARAGATYLFDNGLAPYVSFAQSFLPTIDVDFFGHPFKPTTGTQYEAGVKYQPPGWTSFATLSVYDLTQENVLSPDPDPTHGGASIQIGEVRSRGVELSGVASLSDALSLVGSISYVDPRVTKGGVAFGPGVGATPSGIARVLASLWADYTVKDGPAAGLGFGAGVRYLGASYGDDANTFKVPAATVFDAALRYDFGARFSELKGLSAAINVTNLFDKKYVAFCSGTDYCAYGLRRTVLGTLAYRW